MTLERVARTSGRARQGRESRLLDDLTDWIQRHHQQGGDFSMAAISAAGEAARDALRCGYSLTEAFEAGRSAYFRALDRLPFFDPGDEGITTPNGR